MTRRPPVCANCAGSQTNHSGPDGCWCRACLKKPEEERCQNYTPRPEKRRRQVEVPVDARQRAEALASLRDGSLRKSIFRQVQLRGEKGYTDDELETVMGRSHQSVSAARNGLVKDGLLVDSGEKRPTRYGAEATVWVTHKAP